MSNVLSLIKNKVMWLGLVIGFIVSLAVFNVQGQQGDHKTGMKASQVKAHSQQTATAQKMASAPAAETETQKFDHWSLECVSVADDKRECRIFQKLLQKDKPENELLMVVVAMGTQKIPEKNAVASFPVMSFKTPLGVHVPMGVRTRIDDAEKGMAVPYQFCTPEGCMARTVVAPPVLAEMEKGNKFTVSYQQVARPPLSFELSLKGFSSAFDALVGEFSKGKTAMTPENAVEEGAPEEDTEG